MHNAEFNDPRLVEVYDAESAWARDDDYFVALVEEMPGARVLDLGCGTGRLALGLAAAGHAVTGIDPSSAALAAARTKAGAEQVTWIHGTAESAPAGAFDIAVMTGHVSQFVLSEDEWTSALRALERWFGVVGSRSTPTTRRHASGSDGTRRTRAGRSPCATARPS